ncbi:MAG: HAMP domain-containing protein [Magnetococcales bacterium]|nr:HAMP domain-containing protein [Magnetococcales bacterium]
MPLLHYLNHFAEDTVKIDERLQPTIKELERLEKYVGELERQLQKTSDPAAGNAVLADMSKALSTSMTHLKAIEERIDDHKSDAVGSGGAFLLIQESMASMVPDLRALDQDLEGSIDRAGLIFWLVLALSILIGLALAGHIARPIRQLGKAAVAIGKGQADPEITIASRDEIGDLADAFRDMVRILQSRLIYTQNLLASITDTLLVLDPDGKVRQTHRAEGLFRDNTTLIGLPVTELIPGGWEWRCAPVPSATPRWRSEPGREKRCRSCSPAPWSAMWMGA